MHPVDLVEGELARGGDLVGRVRVHQLEVPAQDRHGRAEFVPHVVEQVLLRIH
ncbi:MAG: hypothetical protein Q7U41_00930 [Microbacterium sp.]|nr:hypothetical protein [Microbacterium sp.]